MYVHRVLAAAVAGLVCLTPLAVTAPARAADTLSTIGTMAPQVYVPLGDGGGFGTVPYEEGDTVSYATEFELYFSLRASDGSVPQQGGAELQIRTATDPTWSGLFSFRDWHQTGEFHYFRPDRSAEYRFVYTGYVAQSEAEVGYAPSATAPFAINVSRAINARTRGLRVHGNVGPDYRHRKVWVLIRDGGRYVPFARVKTNRTTRFSARLPAGRPGKKLHFRLRVPGNARFAVAVEDYVLRY